MRVENVKECSQRHGNLLYDKRYKECPACVRIIRLNEKIERLQKTLADIGQGLDEVLKIGNSGEC